jgi:2-phosphoglycolate phosphatase
LAPLIAHFLLLNALKLRYIKPASLTHHGNPGVAIKLIAFDFDGTLVDTAPDIIRATNDFLLLHRRDALPADEIITHIGMGLISLIRGVVPEAKHHPEIAASIEAQFEKIYDEHYLNSPALFEGAKEFLATWTGKVAIVSNKPERYIRPLLSHLGVDHIPWSMIVGGDTFAEKKPHPMPLESVMKAAGVTPRETLMVGDGPPDMGVAAACGTHLLAVSFGYSTLDELKSLGAQHWINHFNELPSRIAFLEQYEA